MKVERKVAKMKEIKGDVVKGYDSTFSLEMKLEDYMRTSSRGSSEVDQVGGMS